MKIRKAALKDAKGIANVLVQSYNIKDIKEGIEVFRNETRKNHNYIVAEEKGKAIGIVTWLMHGLPKHQLAELDRIAVLPEYRGKGIARKLFEALIKDAKASYKKKKSRLRKLYLLTHADNQRAQKFYEKLGFRHETTLRQHYYKDRDEYVYSMFF
jgi:ribosomal protein S18 acetylase RimI-like enzyme